MDNDNGLDGSRPIYDEDVDAKSYGYGDDDGYGDQNDADLASMEPGGCPEREAAQFDKTVDQMDAPELKKALKNLMRASMRAVQANEDATDSIQANVNAARNTGNLIVVGSRQLRLAILGLANPMADLQQFANHRHNSHAYLDRELDRSKSSGPPPQPPHVLQVSRSMN
jgi:hypothetical protein